MKRKIEVYDATIDDYKEIEVNVIAQYKYIGRELASAEKGKIYDCIGIIDNDSKKVELRIIDEDNEPYIYNANDFELVEQYEDTK